MFNNAGFPIPFNNDVALSGYLELTVNGVAVGLTALTTARFAIVQIQENNVRYLSNGDTPTISKGFLANKNDKIIFEKAELKAGISFIAEKAEDTAKIAVQFYEH